MDKNNRRQVKKSIKKVIGTLDFGLFFEAKIGIFYYEKNKLWYMEIDPPKQEKERIWKKYYK